MAKGFKSGGRKKGSLNKDSAPVQELAQKIGINPLEVLLRVVAGDWRGLGYKKSTVTKYYRGMDYEVELIPLDMRVSAAAEASQYLYAKRKSLEVELDPEKNMIKVIIEDYGGKK